MVNKSIVLVTVDCLRADHVGFMGYSRPTTPFLDSLARESFVFPSAIVAGAPTYYSLPAILASRYPLALGRDVLGIAPGEPTLASALKQAAYFTAAFAAANPYVSARFGYEQGFDRFCDFLGEEIVSVSENGDQNPGGGWASRLNRKLQNANRLLGPFSALYNEAYFQYCQRVTRAPDSLDALRRFPTADLIVDSACEWLSSARDRPFFLWMHLMDPHSPYYPTDKAFALMGELPPTPYRARYLNSFWNRSDLSAGRLGRHRAEISKFYDAGIRWVDAQLERLTSALRQSNLWERCIFAITADHGEEFLDHGGRYHPPSHLFEDLIHVPLLLRVPGAPKKELSKAPFSLLDLAPTLLDAAGMGVPPQFRGKTLWPDLRQGKSWDVPVVAECVAGCTNPFRVEDRIGPRVLAVREKRYKLILHFDPFAERLYDLDSDPSEQAPLSSEVQKPVRRRLLEVAREHVSNSQGWRTSQDRLRARLRDFRLESAQSFSSQPGS